jgi:hypothetical protein
MPGQVRAIVPKEFNSDAVMRTLRGEMEKFAPFLVKDFEKTTAGWQGDKPKFTPVLKMDGAGITIQIRLAGSAHGREKWNWLNYGTKPHKIRAKAGKRLHFQTGYSAGSKPGTTFTSRASRSGGWASKDEVNHPGTAAREWKDLIIKDNQPLFERWMSAAMRNAAKASGHGT